MAAVGSMLRKSGESTLVLYFCLFLLLLAWTRATQDKTQELNQSRLCHEQCAGSLIKKGFVQQQCSNSQSDTSVEGRCCMEQRCETESHEVGNCTKVVVGLDWSHCNLTSLANYTFESVGSTLCWLDVSGNELSNSSIANRAFGGLLNITHLILPKKVDCEESVWENHSSTDHGNLCAHPIWPCGWPALFPADSHKTHNASGNATEFCPEFSSCVDDGPGLHQCVCKPGYYGYKCLLWGEFPYVTFFVSSVSGTLVVIVINWTLRLLHRHYVSSSNTVSR